MSPTCAPLDQQAGPATGRDCLRGRTVLAPRRTNARHSLKCRSEEGRVEPNAKSVFALMRSRSRCSVVKDRQARPSSLTQRRGARILLILHMWIMTLTPREQLRMVNRTNSGSVRTTLITTSPSFLFASAIGRAGWPLLRVKARVRSFFIPLPQPTSALVGPMAHTRRQSASAEKPYPERH